MAGSVAVDVACTGIARLLAEALDPCDFISQELPSAIGGSDLGRLLGTQPVGTP